MSRLIAILGILVFSQWAQAQFLNFTSEQVCNSYQGLVKSYGFTEYWRFLETSGTTAATMVGTDTGTYVGSPTLDQVGPLVMPSKSITLNGSSQYVTSNTSMTGPQVFTLLIWFKTTTARGGKLIGFGNAKTGNSSNYDRHIYMTNAGTVVFGVYPGAVKTIVSPLAYNDGKWHMAAASLSAAGMYLYVDGASVGTPLLTVTSAQSYSGYWRMGEDNLNGWTSSPTSFYFAGSIAEAAVAVGAAVAGTDIQRLYDIGKFCHN